MDEYVRDPKAAFDRNKLPEMGERGGIRYRVSSNSGGGNGGGFNPLQPIFVGEIKDVGIFEVNGKYKAYIKKDNEEHLDIVNRINKILLSGGTIFDAINELSE